MFDPSSGIMRTGFRNCAVETVSANTGLGWSAERKGRPICTFPCGPTQSEISDEVEILAIFTTEAIYMRVYMLIVLCYKSYNLFTWIDNIKYLLKNTMSLALHLSPSFGEGSGG